jgi:hypothetical protein
MRARVFVLLTICALVVSVPSAARAAQRTGTDALPPLPTPGGTPGNPLPPVIEQAPAQIFYAQPFTIVTPDARRIVKVEILQVGGGGKSVILPILGRTDSTLRVAAPASPGDAPQGQYLLFIYAQAFPEPIPSLPALITLSLPHVSPSPTTGHGSPTPRRTTTPGGTAGGGGKGSGGGPVSSGSPGSGGAAGAGPSASAAVAAPASSQHSLGAAPWLGGILLLLLLATFFGLRRMLRA